MEPLPHYIYYCECNIRHTYTQLKLHELTYSLTIITSLTTNKLLLKTDKQTETGSYLTQQATVIATPNTANTQKLIKIPVK